MKVIGLSGTIGSGKQEVNEIIKEKTHCYYVTISDVLKSELEKKKKKTDRKTLQDTGNEMRKQYGNHILAMLAVEYLPRDKDVIIVDGIRNPVEGDYLKKKFGKSFLWLGVDAPKKVRFQRASERQQHNDPRNFKEFLEIDKRDQGVGEPEYGQHTEWCIKSCDVVIKNNGTLKELKKKVDEVLDTFLNQ